MISLGEFGRRIAMLVRRQKFDREMDEEIRLHLELREREQAAKGFSVEEAHMNARKNFGNALALREASHDSWGWASLEHFMQDLRFALRMLRKSPGFTATAVLTLALGIGANTAIFSMVNSLLLRPLPVDQPDQLVVLAFQQKNGPVQQQISYPNVQDVQRQASRVFSDVFAYEVGLDALIIDNKGKRLLTNYVTGNYFTSLGLKPYLGRLILPTEGRVENADPVLVLSYAYWKSQFNGDRDVLNEKVSINGHPVTIVGVAPPGFHGLNTLLDAQGFLPYGMLAIGGREPGFMTNRGRTSAFALARLRSGMAVQQAQAELGVVSQRLSAQYPKDDDGIRFSAYPERLARPDPQSGRQMVRAGTIFLGLTLLVLLLACVNVANILMVRAAARRREMALRAALGAPRGRLVSQLLTESVLLALLGGAAGIVLGIWGGAAVAAVNLKTSIPIDLNFGFDWRVFLFAFGAALFTGVIVGIVPSVRASRADVNQVLREGGRGIAGGKQRLRNVLVMAQVGGSLALLVIAALFMRSLSAVQKVDLGFNHHNVLNLSMDPSNIGYNDAQALAFYKNLLDRVRALPGVQSASFSFAIPFGYVGSNNTVEVQGYQPPAGEPAPVVAINFVSTDYFRTMGIPIERGRAFTDADTAKSTKVAIVSEAMAKKFWPNGEALGRKFKSPGAGNVPLEIVGIARDARFASLSGPIDPYFYLPVTQDPPPFASLQVRTVASPESMTSVIEQQVAALAPGLPLFDVQTMEEALYTLNGLLLFQIGAALANILGLLGLTLAIVGVYGVVSYSAGQRTHEIGIRMALGAQRRDVLKMIFRQGIVIVMAGVVVGLLLAFALARALSGAFFGVSPSDPLTYVSVALLLSVVALLASYIPARRAMRVDPMVALRYE
ncbi:MAG: ABC transporter permease, partial [Silvibacterium sp.]